MLFLLHDERIDWPLTCLTDSVNPLTVRALFHSQSHSIFSITAVAVAISFHELNIRCNSLDWRPANRNVFIYAGGHKMREGKHF